VSRDSWGIISSQDSLEIRARGQRQDIRMNNLRTIKLILYFLVHVKELGSFLRAEGKLMKK
jgi:hypothetical protein